MSGVRSDSRYTNSVHGVLLSACPGGDEVERSSTSGDVEGWPGWPRRRDLATTTHECCLPRWGPTQRRLLPAASQLEPDASGTANSRLSVNGPILHVTSAPYRTRAGALSSCFQLNGVHPQDHGRIGLCIPELLKERPLRPV